MPNYERIERLLSKSAIRKPILEWERSDCLMFLNSITFLQKSSFLNIKSKINGYLKETYGERANAITFLFESIKYSDIDIENDVESNHFFSFDELKYTLEKHIDIICGYQNQITRLPIKMFMTVGWFEIPIDDALRIKKSDVDQDGNIYVNGVLYQFPAKVQKQILQLKDLKEFPVLDTNGRQLVYTMTESEYLFRTTTTPVMSKDSARVKIKELNTNETFKETEKRLSFEKIAMSGVFFRAAQDEVKNGAVYRITGSERLVVLDRDKAERLFFRSDFLKKKKLVDVLRLYDVYKKIAMQTMF